MTKVLQKKFESQFAIRERVRIDGGDVTGKVSAVQFREDYVSYEISWMHNGASMVAWFEPWRLETAS